MKISKPLWAEGALLSPQYFQQQTLWDQQACENAARMAGPHPWGIWQLDWDIAALDLGQLKLRELRLRLPDGAMVDTRQCDPLPAARDLAQAIPPQRQTVEILLGLPLYDAGGDNCGDATHPAMRPKRFFAEYKQVADLFSTASEEMAVERQALALLFDFESHADYVTCPLARLTRNAQGSFELDPGYIPPCLSLTASQPLLDLLGRLCDILLIRSRRLSARRHERNDNIADFSVSDVSQFWLLNCINAAWPELNHLRTHPVQHPERLYLSMARLAGALSTFSLGDPLDAIPRYRHIGAETTFAALERLLRDLLDTVIPSPVIPVELTRLKPTQWRAQFYDVRLTENVDFFLSVHAGMPALQLQEQFPLVCKAGAPDEVERVINSAVGCVPLKALQRVPSAIPLRLENQYFALDATHPAHARMLAARACSFYVPASLPEISLELYAVLRS